MYPEQQTPLMDQVSMGNISTSSSWMISSRPCLPDKLVFFLLIKITNFTAVFTLEDELQRTFQTALSSTQPNNNGEKILMNRPYFIIKKPWKQNDCLVINYFIYLNTWNAWVDKDVVFNFFAHYSCLLFFLFSLYNQMTRSIIYTFIYCCIILRQKHFFRFWTFKWKNFMIFGWKPKLLIYNKFVF